MESHLQVLLLILISLSMVKAMNENLVEQPATMIKSETNCNEKQTLNSTKNYPDINDKDKEKDKEKVSTVISSECKCINFFYLNILITSLRIDEKLNLEKIPGIC